MNLNDYFPFHVFFEKEKGVFNGEDANLSLNDLITLDKIIPRVDGIVAYEIGSWTGMSTCLIGQVAKEYNGRLVAIDSFEGTGVRQKEIISNTSVKKILMNNLVRLNVDDVVSIIEKRSDDVVKDVQDESIDFLFIDGDHRYDQVKRDLDNWWPKIKVGGIISGHDYNHNQYNERYINIDFADNKHHGVIKAVNEKFEKVGVFMINNHLISSVWKVCKT